MSNLKTIFNSKLVSVTMTEKAGTYVYTASFEDGTSHVIRSSGRKYSQVTQVKVTRTDRSNDYVPVASSEFLFSAKTSVLRGKNVIATVQINPGASAPLSR